MCDLPDPKANNRLPRISEDDEFENWNENFDSRLEQASRSTAVQRRSSQLGSLYTKAL